VIVAGAVAVEPPAGEVMLTVGGTFGGVTTTEIEGDHADSPQLSTALVLTEYEPAVTPDHV
jgi:hypothetical protein